MMPPPTVHPFLLGLLKDRDAEAHSPPPPEDHAWETILRDATQDGLTAILYGWLNNSGFGSELPPSLLGQIKANVFGPAARNIVLAQEFAAILRACETRQVPCAPVRGVALAEQLYGDIAARPTEDIDFMVRREDLPRIAEILRSLGFDQLERRPGFSQTYSYSLEFLKNRHGWIVVEPHWTIAYPPFQDNVNMEAVWQRCERRRVLGIESWYLSREDLLLHLCLHLLHRGDSAPLLWLYELDRLIRQDETQLNWAQIIRDASDAAHELLIGDMLTRLKTVFGSPIPDHVLAALAAPAFHPLNRSTPGLLSGWVVRSLVGASSGIAREELAVFFSLKGLERKWQYVCALLFPSPKFMLIRYGLATHKHLPLSYFYRAVSVLWEGVKGLGGLLFRYSSDNSFSSSSSRARR